MVVVWRWRWTNCEYDIRATGSDSLVLFQLSGWSVAEFVVGSSPFPDHGEVGINAREISDRPCAAQTRTPRVQRDQKLTRDPGVPACTSELRPRTVRYLEGFSRT
jgi:hypothetical protein